MDPVSLVLRALASGAARGVTDGAGDAVGDAYSRLKRLIADRFSGNTSAEVALAEHAADPDTWRAPMAKALATTGASADESIIAAARQLMELLDAAGARAGKYDVDLHGGQGVQVGEGNQQVNIFTAVPGIVTAAGQPRIRPGQPRNEAAFGPVYDAVGGGALLGEALGEVYEDGPGLVQHFGGGPDGEPAVICAPYEHVPVAVTQEVWNALRAVGRGASSGGTQGAGFPAADQTGHLVLISATARTIELTGGQWGPGQLVRTAQGRWRWRPHTHIDSNAYQDQDTWSMRREEMDLRLRVALRIPILAAGSRISARGRSRMLTALPATGLSRLIAGLASRYGLEPGELGWQETPEPTGYNDTLRSCYQHVIAGPDGRTALGVALWFTLPHGYEAARAIVDLSVDFDAIRPAASVGTPANVHADLRLAPCEVAAFLSSAWQAAMVLPLSGIEDLLDTPPAGPSPTGVLHPEPAAGKQRRPAHLAHAGYGRLFRVRAHAQGTDNRPGGRHHGGAGTQSGRNRRPCPPSLDPHGRRLRLHRRRNSRPFQLSLIIFHLTGRVLRVRSAVTKRASEEERRSPACHASWTEDAAGKS